MQNITPYKHLQKIERDYCELKPKHCYRLIDDIMGIWIGRESDLIAWHENLNTSHPTIKFTLELSRKQIPFLDTLIYIDNNKIKTKLYKKTVKQKTISRI